MKAPGGFPAPCLTLALCLAAACAPIPDEPPPSGERSTGVALLEDVAVPRPTLVVHGGAGSIRRGGLTAELEAAYRAGLAQALETGYGVLAAYGSALDAVEATIRAMEDSPLFNAGKGAVFNLEGENELDASIMDGARRQAGAVAGATTVRHPISAARGVMERSPHVLLAGPGADAFAASIGLEIVPREYFRTERRWQRYQEQLQEQTAEPSVGTVGAVAIDSAGRIAAGTSTGGTSHKLPGRIGDSPIIGAGTWADDRCGVSSTGHGEHFIRLAVAHEICALVRHAGLSLRDAAERVIRGDLVEAGGEGGVVALDDRGTPVLLFNSVGMYRGWIAEGQPHVAIYGDETAGGY